MHEHKETSRIKELKALLLGIEHGINFFKGRKRFDVVADLEVEKTYTLHLIKEYGQML